MLTFVWNCPKVTNLIVSLQNNVALIMAARWLSG